MRLKLKKGNKTIAHSVELLNTSLGRGVGMMFKTKGTVVLEVSHDSIIETAIHTFFCVHLFIAWINSKHKVVAVQKTVPFWFYSSPKPAKYIFETTDMDIKLKPGDKIRFIEEKTDT
jgi:uncharacterized membrane protein (UPF0127 family)